MSNIKKCDRCGKAYEPFFGVTFDEEWWRYEVQKDCHPYERMVTIDLCPDCRKELYKWLGGKY